MDFFLPRILESRIKKAAASFPVILIVGARQTGKTSLIQNLLGSQAKTYTFDPVQDLYQARKDPDLFLDQIGFPVFLDEIQFAPEILAAIKRRVDVHKKPGMYYLSGSQNFAVMRSIKESLAGRVFLEELYPLSQREIQSQTKEESFITAWLSSEGNLDLGKFEREHPEPKENESSILEILWRGGFPGLIQVDDALLPSYFQSYLQTYIERDIRSLADLHSYQDFGKFIQLLASKSAKEMNENELGRELGIHRKTAVAWKQLAKNSFIWIEVPAFHGNTTKRISSKKKEYLFDTGMLCNLLRLPSPMSLIGHPEYGFIFETYVFMEIYKSLRSLPLLPGISHYRSHGGAEVDLILEYAGKFFPIEIKAKSNPDGNDAKGIHSFVTTFPQNSYASGIIFSNCKIPYKIGENVWTVPYWYI